MFVRECGRQEMKRSHFTPQETMLLITDRRKAELEEKRRQSWHEIMWTRHQFVPATRQGHLVIMAAALPDLFRGRKQASKYSDVDLSTLPGISSAQEVSVVLERCRRSIRCLVRNKAEASKQIKKALGESTVVRSGRASPKYLGTHRTAT